MILFIGLWHLVSVLGVCLAFAAFVGVSALLWFLWDIWQQIEDEKSGVEQRKRDRRSAGAKQGWQTRKARVPYREIIEPVEAIATRADLEPDDTEEETERVMRQIDAQTRAKQQ